MYITTDHKLKVLVVEDSEIVSERISNMLAELEYISLIGSAKNYNDAFILTAKAQPDVVLLDLKLRGKSGLEVLVEMKRHHPAKIIILTNHSELYVRETCRDAGADYFFDKTIDFEKIPDTLNSILQKKMNDTVDEKRYEKVLIIDDDEMDIYVSQRTIEAANFAKEIVSKTCVGDALEYLQNIIATAGQMPDVIFLDMNFPGKNGFDFLKEFRGVCETAEIKSRVMILTNTLENDSTMVQIMLAHPMIQAFIEKPLTLETLKDI
jgi:CheY-like chemotaxis protein